MLRRFLSAALCLCAVPLLAQSGNITVTANGTTIATLPSPTYVIITGTGFKDVSGQSPLNGQVCFAPVNNYTQPQGFSVPGVGQGSTQPQCANVVNGAITTSLASGGAPFTLVNTDYTFPANLCLNMTATESSDGATTEGGGTATYQSGYNCVQTSSSWCSAVSGVTTCNFDNYQPNTPALAVNPAPQFGSATATTLAPGASATATIVPAGNATYDLQLGIPQGAVGPQGPPGTASAAGSNGQVQYNNGSGQLAAYTCVPVSAGGTGGCTAAAALTALGAFSAAGGAVSGVVTSASPRITYSGDSITSGGYQSAPAGGPWPVLDAAYFGAVGNNIAVSGYLSNDWLTEVYSQTYGTVSSASVTSVSKFLIGQNDATVSSINSQYRDDVEAGMAYMAIPDTSGTGNSAKVLGKNATETGTGFKATTRYAIGSMTTNATDYWTASLPGSVIYVAVGYDNGATLPQYAVAIDGAAVGACDPPPLTELGLVVNYAEWFCRYPLFTHAAFATAEHSVVVTCTVPGTNGCTLEYVASNFKDQANTGPFVIAGEPYKDGQAGAGSSAWWKDKSVAVAAQQLYDDGLQVSVANLSDFNCQVNTSLCQASPPVHPATLAADYLIANAFEGASSLLYATAGHPAQSDGAASVVTLSGFYPSWSYAYAGALVSTNLYSGDRWFYLRDVYTYQSSLWTCSVYPTIQLRSANTVIWSSVLSDLYSNSFTDLYVPVPPNASAPLTLYLNGGTCTAGTANFSATAVFAY